MLSAYLLSGSDRRWKSNIVSIGMGPANLPAYEYDIFDRRERGYMADEVEVLYPAAVKRGADGFLRVNYHMLGGRP